MFFHQNFVQNPNFSSTEIQKFRFRFDEVLDTSQCLPGLLALRLIFFRVHPNGRSIVRGLARGDELQSLYRVPWSVLVDIDWASAVFGAWSFLSGGSFEMSSNFAAGFAPRPESDATAQALLKKN